MTHRFLFALAMVGCSNDQKFSKVGYDRVAVVTGDFDRFEAILGRNGLSYTPYEGFISQPTYDAELDPNSFDLHTEELFRDQTEEGYSALMSYDAVFLNSGSRGFGDAVYNGVEADDDLVSDPEVLGNIETFVNARKRLIIGDWGYDLIEAIWPDAIAFLRESDGLDSAQRGARGSVNATVSGTDLVRALGTPDALINYDFSNWAVIESVSSDVTVYMRGDVQVTAGDDEASNTTIEDAPLLVGINVGGGEVIFSTFHWQSQPESVGNALLETVVGRLKTAPIEGGIDD